MGHLVGSRLKNELLYFNVGLVVVLQVVIHLYFVGDMVVIFITNVHLLLTVHHYLFNFNFW